MMKGHRTWVFENRPVIVATATVGGPFEANGNIADDFDLLHEDLWLGEDSYEKAHKVLFEEAFFQAMKKARIEKEQVQFIICGDLINQMTLQALRRARLAPRISVYLAHVQRRWRHSH
ncbi:Stage V sporulation protein AD [Anoxybacillus sp. BCO1]|nr:Stage V sporulation protein AD [Anoxybacillus sp. BCO1]